LIANVSGIDQHNENLKTALSTANPPYWAQKMVNFGPLTKSYRR